MRNAAQLLPLLLAMATFATGTAQGEIPWQANLRTAHAQAQAEGKLLLLHFYSDNCKYCDLLEKGSFQAPQVNTVIGKNFVPVKIHANSSPKLTDMFQVTRFPTDVIVTVKGKTLAHTVSPQDPDRYVAMLRSTLPASTQSPATAPGQQPSDAPIATNQTVPAATLQSPQIQQPETSAIVPTTSAAMTMPASNQTQAQLASTAPRTPSFAIPTREAATIQQTTGEQPTTAQPAEYQSAGHAFVLPTENPAAESLASPNQTEALPARNLILPTQEATQPAEMTAAADLDSVSTPAAENVSTEQPELAMQGYCAVTVINENKWVEGKSEYGVIHLEKLYLFTTEEKMQQFLADPIPYTPVLNEIDVVRFFEERKVVPGKREWGLKDPIHNRMFFFADEAAMNHFYNEYDRYTDAAIKVMDQAIKDANPGS